MSSSQVVSPESRQRKRPVPQVVVVVLAATVFLCVILPWMRLFYYVDLFVGLLALPSAAIWMVVLFWAAYHMTFQVAASFKRVDSYSGGQHSGADVQITMLYLTCDDFDRSACQTAIDQGPEYKVLICDDSKNAKSLSIIDDFANEFPQVEVVRRGDPNRAGYKAGNINYAVQNHMCHEEGRDDWVVILDADQHLPRGYLDRLRDLLSGLPPYVAFVQARNAPHHSSEDMAAFCSAEPPTRFQVAMGHEVDVHYRCTLTWREACGFLPLMGHGAAVRRRALRELAGFPLVVSEDFAFAAMATDRGMTGVYAEHISSWEAFPKDFGAFVARMLKFCQGAGELRRTVKGYKMGRVQRADLFMLTLWYRLAPLIVVNAFLSTYICYHFSQLGVCTVHPFLATLIVGMWLVSLSVGLSVNASVLVVLRHWFWGTAVYAACMPLAAWTFLRFSFGQLFHRHIGGDSQRDSRLRRILFRKPRFEPTAKGNTPSPSFVGWGVAIQVLGISAISLSYVWWCPFAPALMSLGVSFCCFPLFERLCLPTMAGRLARGIVWFPGLLLLWSMFWMWHWAGSFWEFVIW